MAVIDGRPAVVFGHSFGGDIALAAAERHPQLVRAVGTYEAPMSWEPWWPDGHRRRRRGPGGGGGWAGGGGRGLRPADGRRSDLGSSAAGDPRRPAGRGSGAGGGAERPAPAAAVRPGADHGPGARGPGRAVCAPHHLDGTRALDRAARSSGRDAACARPSSCPASATASTSTSRQPWPASSAVSWPWLPWRTRGRPSGSVDVDFEPEEVAAAGRAGRGGVALHAGHAVLEVRRSVHTSTPSPTRTATPSTLTAMARASTATTTPTTSSPTISSTPSVDTFSASRALSTGRS